MVILLSDHNCEGQAQKILYSLQRLGYEDWLEFKMLFFRDVGLSFDASDEAIWLFCQEHDYYLLTGNRSMKDGAEALHAVISRLVNENSLPVITIGDLDRVMRDSIYCEACAESIATIVFNADLTRGIPRLYIP